MRICNKLARLSLPELIKKLKEIAVKKGADPDLIKQIRPDKVVVSDSWVRTKCKFGCPNYGKMLCCPPFAPTPEETKKLLNEYSEALLVGFRGDKNPLNYRKHHKNMHKALIELEFEAFRSGYVKAFVFIAGTCMLCKKCALEELTVEIHPEMAKRFCRHKDKMRPSMEAAGIDVFGTAENAGFEMQTVIKYNLGKVKHFGLLLIK